MTDSDLIDEFQMTGPRGCAKRFGVHRMTIFRRIRKLRESGHDIPPAKNGRPFGAEYDSAALWEMGATMTMTEISRVTGLRYEQVRYAFRKAGTR